MTDELSFRILKPTDSDKIPIILKSASISHNAVHQRTPAWFSWKYWGSPFGSAVVAYAETIDGRIAGMVAYGLYELTKGDVNIKASLTYEQFVHPAFRRRGLYTQLLQMGEAECKERNVQMMFSFPNVQALPGTIKQGWIYIDILRSFIKPVNWMNCVTKFNRHLRSALFIPDRIKAFDRRDYEGFDEGLSMMKSIRADDVWAAARTPEYMIWRYRTYPMNRYVVIRDNVGWALVRTGQRASYAEVQIMEIFPVTNNYSAQLLHTISAQIKKQLQPDIISMTLSKAHPLFPAMLKSGFFPAPNNGNFTYNPLDDRLKGERRSWVLTATEFHTY